MMGAMEYKKYSSALCPPPLKKSRIIKLPNTTARPPQTVATFAPQRSAFLNALAARTQKSAAAIAKISPKPKNVIDRPPCIKEITTVIKQNSPQRPSIQAHNISRIALKRTPMGTSVDVVICEKSLFGSDISRHLLWSEFRILFDRYRSSLNDMQRKSNHRDRWSHNTYPEVAPAQILL